MPANIAVKNGRHHVRRLRQPGTGLREVVAGAKTPEEARHRRHRLRRRHVAHLHGPASARSGFVRIPTHVATYRPTPTRCSASCRSTTRLQNLT